MKVLLASGVEIFVVEGLLKFHPIVRINECYKARAEYFKERAITICNSNGLDFNPITDGLVRLRIFSSGNEMDKKMKAGKKEGMVKEQDYLPENLFRGRKHKETFDFRVPKHIDLPNERYSVRSFSKYKIVVCTLNLSEFERFSEFDGTFDSALRLIDGYVYK